MRKVVSFDHDVVRIEAADGIFVIIYQIEVFDDDVGRIFDVDHVTRKIAALHSYAVAINDDVLFANNFNNAVQLIIAKNIIATQNFDV
jgi:hypothetical protein